MAPLQTANGRPLSNCACIALVRMRAIAPVRPVAPPVEPRAKMSRPANALGATNSSSAHQSDRLRNLQFETQELGAIRAMVAPPITRMSRGRQWAKFGYRSQVVVVVVGSNKFVVVVV